MPFTFCVKCTIIMGRANEFDVHVASANAPMHGQLQAPVASGDFDLGPSQPAGVLNPPYSAPDQLAVAQLTSRSLHEALWLDCGCAFGGAAVAAHGQSAAAQEGLGLVLNGRPVVTAGGATWDPILHARPTGRCGSHF